MRYESEETPNPINDPLFVKELDEEVTIAPLRDEKKEKFLSKRKPRRERFSSKKGSTKLSEYDKK